jgi:hypothetical protein
MSCGIYYTPDHIVFETYARRMRHAPRIVATFGTADRIASDPDWEGSCLGSLRTNRYCVHTIYVQDDGTAQELAQGYPQCKMSLTSV